MSATNEHGISDIRSCEVISVIRTVHAHGKGVNDDPVREITTYWSPEGERLVEHDPWVGSDTEEEYQARRARAWRDAGCPSA